MLCRLLEVTMMLKRWVNEILDLPTTLSIIKDILPVSVSRNNVWNHKTYKNVMESC